mmetsp:Transcript_12463/g.30000  ORF Transcript_12463/g.30000 Transcript_12463/m.30000 type:complete len:82 (-) Transcript_12463:33-278(-)
MVRVFRLYVGSLCGAEAAISFICTGMASSALLRRILPQHTTDGLFFKLCSSTVTIPNTNTNGMDVRADTLETMMMMMNDER